VTTGDVAIAAASAVTTGDDTNVGGDVAADDAGNDEDGAVDEGAVDEGAADEGALCGTNEYDSRATGTCLWMRFTTRRRAAGCVVAARFTGFTRGIAGAAWSLGGVSEGNHGSGIESRGSSAAGAGWRNASTVGNT